MMAMIVLVSLSFMFKSFHCPPSQDPVCPFPDPMYAEFFPHPYDCHYFFHCHNGQAICKKCPEGLHWNNKVKACDYPDHAECMYGNGGHSGGSDGGGTGVTICVSRCEVFHMTCSCSGHLRCRPVEWMGGTSDMPRVLVAPSIVLTDPFPNGTNCRYAIGHLDCRACCLPS